MPAPDSSSNSKSDLRTALSAATFRSPKQHFWTSAKKQYGSSVSAVTESLTVEFTNAIEIAQDKLSKLRKNPTDLESAEIYNIEQLLLVIGQGQLNIQNEEDRKFLYQIINANRKRLKNINGGLLDQIILSYFVDLELADNLVRDFYKNSRHHLITTSADESIQAAISKLRSLFLNSDNLSEFISHCPKVAADLQDETIFQLAFHDADLAHVIAANKAMSRKVARSEKSTISKRVYELFAKPIEAGGGGHCLYLSVKDSLGSGITVQELRNKVADEIDSHRSDYLLAIKGLLKKKPSDYLYRIIGFLTNKRFENIQEDINVNSANNKKIVDGFVRGVRNKEWADDIEISVLMKLYQRPIVVIGPDGKIRNPSQVKDYLDIGDPIFVYYNGSSHYQRLEIKDPNKSAKKIAIELLDLTPRRAWYDVSKRHYNDLRCAEMVFEKQTKTKPKKVENQQESTQASRVLMMEECSSGDEGLASLWEETSAILSAHVDEDVETTIDPNDEITKLLKEVEDADSQLALNEQAQLRLSELLEAFVNYSNALSEKTKANTGNEQVIMAVRESLGLDTPSVDGAPNNLSDVEKRLSDLKKIIQIRLESIYASKTNTTWYGASFESEEEVKIFIERLIEDKKRLNEDRAILIGIRDTALPKLRAIQQNRQFDKNISSKDRVQAMELYLVPCASMRDGQILLSEKTARRNWQTLLSLPKGRYARNLGDKKTSSKNITDEQKAIVESAFALVENADDFVKVFNYFLQYNPEVLLASGILTEAAGASVTKKPKDTYSPENRQQAALYNIYRYALARTVSNNPKEQVQVLFNPETLGLLQNQPEVYTQLFFTKPQHLEMLMTAQYKDRHDKSRYVLRDPLKLLNANTDVMRGDHVLAATRGLVARKDKGEELAIAFLNTSGKRGKPSSKDKLIELMQKPSSEQSSRLVYLFRRSSRVMGALNLTAKNTAGSSRAQQWISSFAGDGQTTKHHKNEAITLLAGTKILTKAQCAKLIESDEDNAYLAAANILAEFVKDGWFTDNRAAFVETMINASFFENGVMIVPARGVILTPSAKVYQALWQIIAQSPRFNQYITHTPISRLKWGLYERNADKLNEIAKLSPYAALFIEQQKPVKERRFNTLVEYALSEEFNKEFFKDENFCHQIIFSATARELSELIKLYFNSNPENKLFVAALIKLAEEVVVQRKLLSAKTISSYAAVFMEVFANKKTGNFKFFSDHALTDDFNVQYFNDANFCRDIILAATPAQLHALIEKYYYSSNLNFRKAIYGLSNESGFFRKLNAAAETLEKDSIDRKLIFNVCLECLCRRKTLLFKLNAADTTYKFSTSMLDELNTVATYQAYVVSGQVVPLAIQKDYEKLCFHYALQQYCKSEAKDEALREYIIDKVAKNGLIVSTEDYADYIEHVVEDKTAFLLEKLFTLLGALTKVKTPPNILTSCLNLLSEILDSHKIQCADIVKIFDYNIEEVRQGVLHFLGNQKNYAILAAILNDECDRNEKSLLFRTLEQSKIPLNLLVEINVAQLLNDKAWKYLHNLHQKDTIETNQDLQRKNNLLTGGSAACSPMGFHAQSQPSQVSRPGTSSAVHPKRLLIS